MSRCYEQSWDCRLAHQRTALLAKTHVSREVTGLLALHTRLGEDGAEGADIRDNIIALSLVALYLVRSVRESNGGVWLTY